MFSRIHMFVLFRKEYYLQTSGFWPRVRARALRAPVFLDSSKKNTKHPYRTLLSYAAPYWPCCILNSSPAPYWAMLHLLCYAALYLAALHLTELHCTWLSYAANSWAKLHPIELRCTLYIATLHPIELRCSLLSYAAPFWAMLHPIWTTLHPLS
jgi:hypothetical protein